MTDEFKLRSQAFRLIIALGVQFALGMSVNLFVSFPESGSAANMWEFVKHQPLVMAHIIFGTGLIVGSIMFVVKATHSQLSEWIRIAWFGLLFVLLAWISGERFVSTQQDIFSFSMAMAFILGVITYSVGIVRPKLSKEVR